MAIQRTGSGFEDFMPQSFSSMLDRFFQDSVNSRERMNRFQPLVDTCETQDGYQIDVALPGLKKEDITLDVRQGQLTISGERQFKKEEKDKKYHLIESQYGTFSRSFQLPDTIDPERIEAVFEEGILHVTVPKDERKTATRRIEVRDGSAHTVQLSQDNTLRTASKKNGTPSLNGEKKEPQTLTQNGQ
ncbi:Hsp20/alpha crystallin family protein [Rufibacter sp. LB8]|nr:Hsp20/alpha crystallin family protein [Rufibacter sp. LB8]